MKKTLQLPRGVEARVKAIAELLIEMLELPKEGRPFVVVTHTLTGKFTQFAGSRSEELLIDCPALNYSRRMPGTTEGPELDAVVGRAFDLLETQVGPLEHKELHAELEWTTSA